MRLLSPAVRLAIVILFLAPAVGRADTPSPLRFVPSQAELVVTLNQPRHLLETVLNHDLVKDVQKIETVRELFDTTNVRRFQQLLAYYEKELGHQALDLLEGMTGGGVALAARFSNNPAALLVIQGRKPELLQRFVALSRKIAQQEMARQEIKEKLRQDTYRGHPTFHVGKQVNIAVVDGALLVASDAKVLHAAIDLAGVDSTQGILNAPAFAEARKVLPDKTHVQAWLDMGAVRKIKNFKDGLDAASLDPNGLILFGGLLDMMRRAPHVSAALVQQERGFGLSLHAPCGRAGMKAATLLTPADERGSLPLLEPSNALLSTSYFLDLGKMWDDRAKIFNPAQVKGLEKAEQDTAKFLLGTKLSSLLRQAGSYHRFVLTAPPRPPEQSFPGNPFAAFGYGLVLDMREKTFAKSMETILRGAALFGTFNTPLKMFEEKHGSHVIVSYRLLPDKNASDETNRSRANFTPSFSHVGNQFVMSSSVELCRELLDLVQSEKNPQASPASTQVRLCGACGIAYLRNLEDQLLTTTILNQALPPQVARQQVKAFTDLVAKLGSLTLEVRYEINKARYELRWQPN